MSLTGVSVKQHARVVGRGAQRGQSLQQLQHAGSRRSSYCCATHILRNTGVLLVVSVDFVPVQAGLRAA